MSESHGFPKWFTVQSVKLHDASQLVELPPAEIVQYFRGHPEAAEELMLESSDKRYVPSTFITITTYGYQVGWYSKKMEYVQEFSNLEDAATDYLLFSLGKARWTPDSQ